MPTSKNVFNDKCEPVKVHHLTKLKLRLKIACTSLTPLETNSICYILLISNWIQNRAICISNGLCGELIYHKMMKEKDSRNG